MCVYVCAHTHLHTHRAVGGMQNGAKIDPALPLCSQSWLRLGWQVALGEILSVTVTSWGVSSPLLSPKMENIPGLF